LITDRLTHAIDQLGNDKVDVRIGGIYALERLAKDSASDWPAIGEILAAFIRAHAAWSAGHLGDSNLVACYAAGIRWERCRFVNTDRRKTRLPGAMLDRSTLKPTSP
jgi:hypothetical protein